jgi:hypothetical protein
MKPVLLLSIISAGIGFMLLTRKNEASTPIVPTPKTPTTPRTPSTPAVVTPKLSAYEQFQLENWDLGELYTEAMKSTSKVFVAAVANKLAEAGNTNAGDLTLRLANWSE